MIVLCSDGFYYKNPVWSYDRMTVAADLEITVAYAYNRPVKERALRKPLRQLIGEIKLAEGGEMGWSMVNGKFRICYLTTLTLIGEPKPPQQFDAKFGRRPDDVEDEIVDDYSIEGIKKRWTSKK